LHTRRAIRVSRQPLVMSWLHCLACRLTLVGRGQAVDRTGLLGAVSRRPE
jgi:hypothetical protein